jgi:methylmalonyl-CoA mutase
MAQRTTSFLPAPKWKYRTEIDVRTKLTYMNASEELFSGFEPTSKEQWKAKAIEDLKGADFDKKLVWTTDDGFSVQPFYTSEDFSDKEELKAQHRLLTQTKRAWINYTQLLADDAVKANALAVQMVSFGATGILFKFEKEVNIDFNVLLQNLNPEQVHISFATSIPLPGLVSGYFTYLSLQKIGLSKINGFYTSDVLESWSTLGNEPDFDALYEVILAAQPAPGFKALPIQSHAFVNAGARTTQELAFPFNKLTDYFEVLSSKGLDIGTIADNLLLHYAISGDYFFEIAKLRAARILLKSILAQYGVAVTIDILSSGSLWSKTAYDPNMNMLRNTTEAMSAVLGGCDALLIHPHDFTSAQSSPFGLRVALNVSNLLKEESYFDKVLDPAAGSYYIESLTASLVENALQTFQQVEQQGGYIQAFKAGVIQRMISDVRSKKQEEISSRQRVYLGANKYPDLREKAPFTENAVHKNKDGLELLPALRAPQSFEEIKSRTLRHFEETAYMPKVYLACFGSLSARKARAAFAAEFFALAGFELLGEFNFTDVKEAAKQSAMSDADLVVMCSSDADYEGEGVAFAETFKSLSPGKLLVLAGYPESIVESLHQAGLDAFIHMKSNAVELLAGIQNKLFIDKQ